MIFNYFLCYIAKMKLHDDFFNRIKMWAKKNNTTIEAIMSGSSDGKWTQAMYYGWRQCEGLPKGENIAALAQYMGVSLDWLVFGSTPSDSQTEKIAFFDKYASFFHDFERLDEGGRYAVIQLAHTLAQNAAFKTSNGTKKTG